MLHGMTSGLRPEELLVRLATIVSVCWLAPSGTAQDARAETPFGSLQIVHSVPESDDAKFHLWVAYRDHLDTYRDDAHYIAELQAHWSPKGVVVGVIMPPDSARVVAKEQPAFRVLTPDKDNALAIDGIRDRVRGGTLLCGKDGSQVILTSATLDGQHDALLHLTEDRDEPSLARVMRTLNSTVANVADGGLFSVQVKRCLQALPNTGRAHAANVLCQWWCIGDVDAARQAVFAGLDALADDSLPLVVFADLVLRGDQADIEVKKRIAAALAQHAPTHKNNARFQLVYLRALLHTREDRRAAGRAAAMLPRLLKGRPLEQIHFAETLMDAELPMAFRDQAEHAIKSAENPANPVMTRWVFCARHKLLTRCGDTDAAEKLMIAYRKHPVGKTDYNNDAWYLMVQNPSMGRFDTLAFAQGKKMEKDDGANISTNNRDTLALTYFVNGHYERALELQNLATKGGANGAFLGRLKRYEATVARMATKKGDGK